MSETIAVDVILTDHFITQLYSRQSNFPTTRFFTHLPVLIDKGKKNLGDQCMIRFGDAKLIFIMKPPSGHFDHKYRLVMITVMPDHFKHNFVNQSLTVDVGSVK